MTNDDILKYEKYVYGVAKKFDGYKNKEDLIQVGFLGLIMALRNYKRELNSKFTTYAYKYIYGEMCKLVREDKGIKISKDMLKLKNSIEKARSILNQKLGRDPTTYELASFLEIPVIDIEECLKVNINIQSLDMPFNTGGKEINLYDAVEKKQMDIDTLISLKTTLSNLDQEQMRMLNLSFNMTEREIGDIYDMSQVKVSRTIKKIKENIKVKMQ